MVIRLVGEYESISTECLLLPKEYPSEERIVSFWHFLKSLFYPHRAETVPPSPSPSSSFPFPTLGEIGNVGYDYTLSYPLLGFCS